MLGNTGLAELRCDRGVSRCVSVSLWSRAWDAWGINQVKMGHWGSDLTVHISDNSCSSIWHCKTWPSMFLL